MIEAVSVFVRVRVKGVLVGVNRGVAVDVRSVAEAVNVLAFVIVRVSVASGEGVGARGVDVCEGTGVGVNGAAVGFSATSDGMAVPTTPPAESVPTRTQSIGINVP